MNRIRFCIQAVKAQERDLRKIANALSAKLTLLVTSRGRLNPVKCGHARPDEAFGRGQDLSQAETLAEDFVEKPARSFQIFGIETRIVTAHVQLCDLRVAIEVKQ